MQRRGIDDEHAKTCSPDDSIKVVHVSNRRPADCKGEPRSANGLKHGLLPLTWERELGLDGENLPRVRVSGDRNHKGAKAHVETLHDKDGQVNCRQ